MAKTAKAKTPVQITADKTREAYKKAKDANTKSDNATTQKALADAKSARDAAVSAEARERFENIGNARVSNAVKVLGNIGKMNQPRNYKYSDADVSIIEKLLSDGVKGTITALRVAIAGKSDTAEAAPANIFTAAK